MKKRQLIGRMADHANGSQAQARKHLDAFTQAISEALEAGEEIQLPGFGKFYVRKRKARKGTNPQTGEEMRIKARNVPTFKANKALRERV